ncbi:MAG: ribosome rescue GTPase HflX [Pseudomonadota bacterium]|nr:ribosome rescue GTPase HflX [Pseudomonadota bacterium]
MFERYQGGERAIVLHIGKGKSIDLAQRAEFNALSESAGAVLVDEVKVVIRSFSPSHLLNQGKIDEIQALIKSKDAEVLLVNHTLSPRQEKNLEANLQCRVIDRTGLILDIFALRARSFEGKLQVELAQLQHLSTRLVRGWTHLERQKGGIGLRGPGETQLESDRRMVNQAIKRLNKRLDQVNHRRQRGRQHRKKYEIPTVSLVGYTNAGKSTLFNKLCGSNVTVKDQLFATLDPTLRKLKLPQNCDIILVDTVGFVRDLPYELIASFKSTLEETRDARLLLHVVDCADSAHLDRISDVDQVLATINANDLPVILVYNKADIIKVAPRIDRAETGLPWRVWISSKNGDGLDLLRQAIAEFILQGRLSGTVRLKTDEGHLRALLYEFAHVMTDKELSEGGWELAVEIGRDRFNRLQRNHGLEFLQQQEIPSLMAKN